MAYLRCTKCGSKALVAASQCPRCAQPFHLTDARGERVKLKRCRGCGIMHRADATCHWCGELKTSWRLSGGALRHAAAVAVMLVGAGAVWRMGPSLVAFGSDVVSNVAGDVRWSRATVTRSDAPSPVVQVADGAASTAGASATESPVAGGPMVSDSASALVSSPGEDSITWTPAVARTWVNVRSDASRGGQVVGVIKPTTRAMLGTDRAGWRQVKSTEISGWVDPRLFESDSLRTRGE